ncbi:polymorphic toxin-type HINT domain-containing protein [Streptomyces milbemycinicus]|uniref:polymorphic toxin-type HINT domain-containing protein n=1 Tax=Streptomyces milbemycinicus TaxID=476552 RepID=UPI0034035A11
MMDVRFRGRSTSGYPVGGRCCRAHAARATGKTTARPVVATIVTKDDKEFTDLTINTVAGPASIIATDTHPFWVTSDNRWADAGDLTAGMKLRTNTGATVTVTAVRHFTKQQRTYDLTVDSIHTYYVLAGKTSVLVHNTNCANPGTKFDVSNEAGVCTIHLNDGIKYVGSSVDSMRTLVNKSMRSKHAVRKAGYGADDIVNVTWIPLPSGIGTVGARRV